MSSAAEPSLAGDRAASEEVWEVDTTRELRRGPQVAMALQLDQGSEGVASEEALAAIVAAASADVVEEVVSEAALAIVVA